MRIGELAARSGLAASRIRFYEASSLIGSVPRTANGYRDYPSDTVGLLHIIERAQSAGFSLSEIRNLLPTFGEKNWKSGKLLATLKEKIRELERLQREIAQNKAELHRIVRCIEGKSDASCAANLARVLSSTHKISRQLRPSH